MTIRLCHKPTVYQAASALVPDARTRAFTGTARWMPISGAPEVATLRVSVS
jgi:hypothetical protein